MVDETLTTKEQYYDLKKYKDEVALYIKGKRIDLDKTAMMYENYLRMYSSVYAGTVRSDVERFPHAAEMFKVYKSAIIESNLSGYSALLEIQGRDAYSMLKVPELKNVMTDQFRSISLLENLTTKTLDDWLLMGEAVAFIKLRENKEEYRMKETLVDNETGAELMKFKIKEIISSKDILIERINPLDFFVDAYDYERDPRGCTKIVRNWISAKTLLTSNAYPLLSQEDKDAIIASAGKNGSNRVASYQSDTYSDTTGIDGQSRSDRNNIEVLTFYGDYITNDNKVLVNIVATVIGNRCANIKYSDVSTNRIIYAGYKIDDETHRSISPLAVSRPVNTLINRCIDMFLKNLEDASIPYVLYQKGSLNKAQVDKIRTNKEIEYNSIEQKPEFWAPPIAAPQGLQLAQMVLEQNKNVLGINNYLAGNTDGAVRTARESSILFQKANARMRVETDVFSYNFLLNLFTSFYAFNRELALAVGEPLDDIYADEKLNVAISTNASRADKEGELQRLMSMLQLPIAQMIFANLTPDQVILAVRYLMSKAELSDVDNILELMKEEGGETTPPPPMPVGGQGQVSEGEMVPSEIMPTPDMNPNEPPKGQD